MSRKPEHLKRKPVLGCAFDPDQNNEAGNVESYLNEIEHYRPRGFSKLAREGERLVAAYARGDNAATEFASEWMTECDDSLTEHATRCGMDYVYYGPFPQGGAVGYYADTESAIADANHVVDDSFRGRDDGPIPRGFTGLSIRISDHGNVSAYAYRRGKSRELWSVV